MNSPSPRNPEVRPTTATAANSGPNVPSRMSSGASDGEIDQTWRLAATNGSQHSQEVAKAVIVNTTASGTGRRRTRITADVTRRFDPPCFRSPHGGSGYLSRPKIDEDDCGISLALHGIRRRARR